MLLHRESIFRYVLFSHRAMTTSLNYNDRYNNYYNNNNLTINIQGFSCVRWRQDLKLEQAQGKKKFLSFVSRGKKYEREDRKCGPKIT